MNKVYAKGAPETMRSGCRGLSFLCRPSAGPRLFEPVPGEFYDNVNGQTYQCITLAEEPNSAVMENVKSGWRFVTHRLVLYGDGCIEWGCSTSGRFVR